MQIHILTDEDLQYGDILAHLSKLYEYSVSKGELMRLNPNFVRSDAVTGKVRAIILSEEE